MNYDSAGKATEPDGARLPSNARMFVAMSRTASYIFYAAINYVTHQTLSSRRMRSDGGKAQ